MGNVRYAIFSCSACGKKYAWKPQSAGKTRVCECGHFIPVPLAATADSSVAGQSLAGESISGQLLAGESHAGKVMANGVFIAPRIDEPPQYAPHATNILQPPTPPTTPLDDLRNALTEQCQEPQETDENCYEVRDTSRFIRRGPIPDLATLKGANLAELAEGKARLQREQFAQGTVWREWVAPCVLILIGSIIDAIEMQRHLARIDATTFLGRAVSFYLSVSAIGVLGGILLMKLLLRINYGRGVTSWFKWIGLTVTMPAVWILVVELFLRFHLGGESSLVAGVWAGWIVDCTVIYILFGRLFDLEPLDLFWTVASINSVKLALFVTWYFFRGRFNLL